MIKLRHGKTKQQQQSPATESEVAETTAETKWGRHPEGLYNQFISKMSLSSKTEMDGQYILDKGFVRKTAWDSR